MRKTQKYYKESEESKELYNYITNNTYMFGPYFKTLRRRKENGNLDKETAIQGLYYISNTGAKEYHLEHGTLSTKWTDIFSVTDRYTCACDLYQYFENWYHVEKTLKSITPFIKAD